jgi:hypothetical protein
MEVRLAASGGKNPEKYDEQLIDESHEYTMKKIQQTGTYDIIFNLHDNTIHPEVWKYEKRIINDALSDMVGEKINFDKTEEGYVVAPADVHVSVFHYDNPKLESLIKSFRPRIYPKIQYDIDERALFSNNMIALEYVPARFDRWTKQVEKMSVSRGLKFLTRLLYHVRDSYE